jgi:hypothetical protein
MNIRAYIYHKKAEEYSDCQDYFEISSQNNRIAVSDGMSQSIYPQWWAEILVKSFIENGEIPEGNVLKSCQDEWQRRVNDEVKRREDNGINPWRLKNTIAEKSGAGATLCGLTCEESKWTCDCIGDSCLILIKKDFNIDINTSQDGAFDNYPDYLDSYTTGRGQVKKFEGVYDDAEMMLLVTDPFAELFQKHADDVEFIKQLTEQLRQLSTHESFVELVERWRTEYQMHNDDSTIVIMDNTQSRTFEISHEDNLAELSMNDESPAPQQMTVTHKEESPDEGNLSQQTAEENAKKAVLELLGHYNGKKSKNKVNNWLDHFFRPLINDFLNH